MTRPPWQDFQTFARVHWYPGHMEKAMKHLHQLMRRNHIGHILEVRDARIPLTSISPRFEALFLSHPKKSPGAMRPSRTIVYNKVDFIEGRRPSPSWRKLVVAAVPSPPQASTSSVEPSMLPSPVVDPVYFFSSKSPTERRQTDLQAMLMGAVRRWIEAHSHWPAHQDLATTKVRKALPPLHILVAGLPNAGKSSLINQLRVLGLGRGTEKGTPVARVGRNPGFTRSLSNAIKIVDTSAAHPHGLPALYRYLRGMGVHLKIYVVDSPGILPQRYDNVHSAVKLALVNALPNDIAGSAGADTMLLAEYLWWRIKNVERGGNELQCNRTSFASSDDSFLEMLRGRASRERRIRAEGQLNLEETALHFVRSYQDGTLLEAMSSREGEDKERKGEEWNRMANLDDGLFKSLDAVNKSRYLSC